jgi:benzoyl-CoA reductase subunit C
MPELERIVAVAEELYYDLRLGRVSRWKEEIGGLAVGYLPVYAPRELLWAQGVLPVADFGGGDQLEIIRGDAYYQSYICHLPRSTIELGLNGALDCLDGMIFPATCDVIRNLSGMWQLEFPERLACYLDVPQNFDPEVGGAFFRAELEQLAAELAARGARPYDPEALRRSIELYNAQRRLVEELYALRRRRPWKVPTHELYLVLRAAALVPVEEGTQLLAAYRDAVAADEQRRPMDQARVLLTGSFCEQPPLGLLKTLERAGCYIVDDDLVEIHRWIQGDVAVDGDPLDALVEAFLACSIASPIRYIDEEEKGAALLARTRECAAEGVLFCAPSFCDPALLDQPMTIRAVEAAGIPWTAFKYSENGGQFQVIREQAGTFSDSIKLWSGE